MWMMTEAEMARRIDWEKRRFDGMPGRSMADEREFHEHDLAARWLEGAERWEERKKKIFGTAAKRKNKNKGRLR